MAKTTVAELEKIVEELREFVDEQIEDIGNTIATLEERIDSVESSGDKRKKRGRNMTPEQRREAGIRLQQARAEKLGLETIEQLRELHLRPGEKPTKKQITAIKKEFPADDFDIDEYLDAKAAEEDE